MRRAGVALPPRTPAQLVQWAWADPERPGLRTVQRKLMENDLVALANDDSMKKRTKIPRE